MKKTLFLFICLIASAMAFAKPVQITVKPDFAAQTAQVFEKGSPVSGSNGVFRVELGFLQEKTLTIKADGFDQEELFISFKHKQDAYTVTLKPNRKKAVVTCNVPDATIYIDGTEKGKGKAEFNIMKVELNKKIKIEADGYDTFFGTIGFNDNPGIEINKECTLVPNRKDVYISVNQVGAQVFADGKPVGVVAKGAPVKITINKGKPVFVRVSCDGYMDVTGNVDFSDSDVTYDLGDMPEDEAWFATDFKSSDIANQLIPIKVRKDMDRDEALRSMMYYITKEFRDLDVNNYTAGWIRTKWNIDKFKVASMQIRTRVELKQAPSDSDGLLKFDLLIESQYAAPDATPDDQNFKEYHLLLKRYKRLSEDVRHSVEAIK